jgi:hypothetical protein
MSATAEETAKPTEDAPMECVIGHTRYDDLVLCEVLRWEEDDGTHVVRAADFDLFAVGDDPREAVRGFVREVHSLFFSLSGLVNREQATEDEHDLHVRIGTPIVEAWRRDEERRQARLVAISFPRLRRRGGHSGDWRSGSSRRRSQLASTA